MLKKIQINNNLVYFFIFAILVSITKYWDLGTPLYWDELLYRNQVSTILENNFTNILPGYHASFIFSGHAPVFHSLVAVFCKIFEYSPFFLHLPILCFAIGGLCIAFLLGKMMGNSLSGLLTSLLLFSSPVYFTQSAMLQPDLPLGTLSMLLVYLFLKEKHVLYLFAGVFTALFRESSFAVTIPIAIYCLLFSKYLLREKLYYVLVSLAIPIYWFIEKLAAGNYFDHNDGFSTFVFNNLELFINGFVDVMSWVFFDQNRYWLTLILVMAMIQKIVKKDYSFIGASKYAAIFFMFVIFIIVFATDTCYCPRYLFPAICLLMVVAGAVLNKLVSNVAVKVSILVFLIVLNINSLHSDSREMVAGFEKKTGSFELDMQYKDVIKVHHLAVKYIVDNYRDHIITVSWPMDINLTDSGFGSDRFANINYHQHPFDHRSVTDNFDLLVMGSNVIPKEKIEMETIIANKKLVLIKQINVNNHSVKFFANPISSKMKDEISKTRS